MSFDIIKHFTISYTPKFNNEFNDIIEICNMLLGLSICINKLWGINDMNIFINFGLPMVHSKTHGIPKNTHIYCARRNFCNILLSLQGSHKLHCLRKKENIRGYKTYFATLPSQHTPTPLKSNAKFIFKVHSSLMFLWFCFFLEHKIIETTYPPYPPPTHTHICSSQSEMQNSYSRHPSFLLLSFYIVWNKNLSTKLVFKA